MSAVDNYMAASFVSQNLLLQESHPVSRLTLTPAGVGPMDKPLRLRLYPSHATESSNGCADRVTVCCPPVGNTYTNFREYVHTLTLLLN